jgi:DNA-binding NtrC family response regulator
MVASAFHPCALAEAVAGDEGDPASSLTLYLKDVENLSPEGQAYLLSLLESGEYRASYGTLPLWVLSSSCVDLRQMMYKGEFSTQLYYFLTVFTLFLPPLRERKGEIADLVEFFAEEAAQRLGLGKVIFAQGAINRLQNHLWFGNAAELETVVARTLAVHRKSRIEEGDLLFGHESILPPLSSLPEAPSTSVSLRPAAFLRPLAAIVGELAHKLKNPMVTLKTFIHYINRAVEDEEFRNKFSLLITEAVERMNGTLEEVLEYSRLAVLLLLQE